ncbi:MAG TPA: GNAT family N-acetyltransferase [Daejeonella sp.]|nr:GNAT family N-acetyltransferase [Daejeonella sp.]
MEKLTIRPIVASDTEMVLDLMKALAIHHNHLEYLKIDCETFIRYAFCENPIIGMHVAELDSEIVGYVSYTRNFSIWAGSFYLNIDDVFVRPEFRSLGVGGKMMQWVQSEKSGEINRIRWEVEKDNHRAIQFYENLGAILWIKGICNWSI